VRVFLYKQFVHGIVRFLFHRNGGCAIHGFIGMMGAECMVYRNDGCVIHGFTGMMGAERTIQPG